MAYTHTITCSVQTPEGTLSTPVTVTGSQAQAIDDTTPDSTTDQLVSVAFTRAALKSFYFVCDKAVQIETNAADHSGGDLFTLPAGEVLRWHAGGNVAQIFSADVTKMYLTTGAVGTATWSLRVLQDGTP